MTFIAPWGLLALMLVPVAVGAWLLFRRLRPPSGVPHPDLTHIEAAAAAPSKLRYLPAALALLGVALLAFALGRPQVDRDQPREQASIMLAIDVSGSMAADDVAPYRLRAAQDAAKRFADTVPRQYQVGLVSFSGVATIVLPPTTDRAALNGALDSLVADGATAIGDAVDTSLAALREGQGGAEELVASRILLLSDGASTTGLPVDLAARDARAAGVPVFTVALGTNEGVLPDGRRVPPAPEALSRLAEITEGQAFESRDAGSVSQVYERLGSFIGTVRVKDEITAWPAVAGALLLLLAGIGAWRLAPRLS
ncbi:MAG: VWA domain-containing protein [Thermoleophilia bacterium]|nr:VWA domain-containing protein [Thermoleophilia bacterium]MDH3724533.1 VWA domain-containing protein [Thermoleophilia bacterium]